MTKKAHNKSSQKKRSNKQSKETGSDDIESASASTRPKLMSSTSSNQCSEASVGDASNVFDIVLEEKIQAIDNPSKSPHLFCQRTIEGTTDFDASPTPTTPHRQASTGDSPVPGAYRMRGSRQSPQQDTVSIMTGEDEDTATMMSSDGSESCVIVIPRASLVREDKDLEAPPTAHVSPKSSIPQKTEDIPMVVAEEAPQMDHSKSIAKSKKGKKRAFRWAVLFCLLMIAGLLAGLVLVLRDNGDGSGGGKSNGKDGKHKDLLDKISNNIDRDGGGGSGGGGGGGRKNDGPSGGGNGGD